ncbi:hypothetical protein [Terriglobus aquaticus]|uniref:Uncharacterized protein n=2 Tax=Terriglobus aquaticus TaxID=940139 RepID=A0ABW9KK60_9BACT
MTLPIAWRYTDYMLEMVMALLRSILVPLFIVGMVGSTVVVAITFVHDVIDFAAEDEPGTATDPRG